MTCNWSTILAFLVNQARQPMIVCQMMGKRAHVKEKEGACGRPSPLSPVFNYPQAITRIDVRESFLDFWLSNPAMGKFSPSIG